MGKSQYSKHIARSSVKSMEYIDYFNIDSTFIEVHDYKFNHHTLAWCDLHSSKYHVVNCRQHIFHPLFILVNCGNYDFSRNI